MIVVIVTFVVVTVVAGAGVFQVVAGRAVVEVQVEFFADFLRVVGGLDRDDDREVIALREGLIRDERITFFGELHLDRVFAITGDDIDALLAKRNGFSVIIDGGDLHLAVLGHEELEVRFDFGEDATAVGAGYFLAVVVTFMVIVVGMFLVVVAFVITFFVIIREGEWGGDESDGGCRDGQDISWFHFFSFGF